MARGRPRIYATMWDRPGIAEKVDRFWRTHPSEITHREWLATCVARYALSNFKLLDVGCGTGLLYELLAKQLADLHYVGIDYSPAMLALAKEHYSSGADFRVGNIEALDYPDNWFDMSVAFEVMGYLDSLAPAITELTRVAHRTIFTIWLTAESKSLRGKEHWEHTDAFVKDAIASASATVIYQEGGNPVMLYVVEKK